MKHHHAATDHANKAIGAAWVHVLVADAAIERRPRMRPVAERQQIFGAQLRHRNSTAPMNPRIAHGTSTHAASRISTAVSVVSCGWRQGGRGGEGRAVMSG